MKWFKHNSDSDSSPEFQSLIIQFGYQGLGWYWHILELIARSMSKSDPSRCWIDRTLLSLASELKARPETIKSFLSFSEESGLLASSYRLATALLSINSAKPSDLLVRISAPKLLILKDEYFSKSGHTSDKGRESVGTVDIDRDEREREKLKEREKTADNQLLLVPDMPSIPEPVQRVYSHWQSFPCLPQCRKLNGHQSAINSALEYVGGGPSAVEIVCLCISRYAQLIRNDHGCYRSVYVWSLSEFLKRRAHYNIDRLSRDDWEREFIQWEQNNKQKRNPDMYVGQSYD